MRTEQIKVFKFEELKPEIQEKVLDNFRNSENYLNYEWYEYFFENFKEDLNKISVDFESLNFDLYRNEISFSNINILDDEKFINSFMNNDDKIFNSLNEKNEISFSVGISENGYVSLDYDTEEDLTEEDYNQLKLKIEELEAQATEFLRDKLKQYLNQLHKEYEYLLSDEAIKDTIDINEYEFEENGEQF